MNLPFSRITVLPVEDGNVTHEPGELASRFGGNLKGQFFPPPLEIDELYFDQLVGVQCLTHGRDQGLDDALLAHMHHGFQMMSEASEMLSVRSFQHIDLGRPFCSRLNGWLLYHRQDTVLMTLLLAKPG